jgi:FKBP-type peptidyl-prolyl cis-trans isomerase/CubicO group peptidase (beta-lactamase class C family)
MIQNVVKFYRLAVFLFALCLLVSSCSKEENGKFTEEERSIRDYIEEKGYEALITESGIYYVELQAGTGPAALPGHYIIAHYTLRLISDRVVDTTDEDQARANGLFSPNRIYGPAKFKLDNHPLQGVKEGLQLMKQGGRAVFVIPSGMAYGQTHVGNIPAGSVLVCEMELIEVIDDPVEHEQNLILQYLTENDIEDNSLASGLYYIPISEGSEDRQPEMNRGVAVHYKAWFIDGRLYQDATERTEEFILGRNTMPQGVEEALLLMKVGGKARLIVPSHLAYGEEGSSSKNVPPYMTLIYEVELVDIFDSYPGANWTYWESFEDVGFNPSARAEIQSMVSNMNTTGLMVVVDGRVLFDYGNLVSTTYLASVRKSILSMLYGIYVHKDVIDLTKTLDELGIDDNQGLLPIEKQATIRDVISARSGVYHPASNTGDDSAHAPPRGSVQPGTYFLYNNWDFNAAGSIFEQLTSTNIYDALRDDLAIPLQMQDFDRSLQRKGGNSNISRHPAYHMYISTRDMARLGLLMLNEGRWLGDQIIPSEWVVHSTSAITPVFEMNPDSRRSGNYGYGYMWWVFNGEQVLTPFVGAYTAIGAYGQYITIIPSLNMVVSHKTDPDAGNTSQTQYYSLLQMIVNAARP